MAITHSLRAALPCGRDAVDAAVEIDVLLDGQVLVQREPLAHVADVGLDLFGLRADVEAGHRAPPAVGARMPQSMRMVVDLPAPLGPEEAEDLAAARPGS